MALKTLAFSLLLAIGVSARDTRRDAAPVVDLGYAKYQGTLNSTFNTTVYRGLVGSRKKIHEREREKRIAKSKH